MSLERSSASIALFVVALVGSAFSTSAQQWPTKQIRIIVPYQPGGVSDLAARFVTPKLTEAWGQQVIVDNRPGGSGTIGVGAVVVALTFFSLVIGELVPKRLALSNPERVASLLARPLDALSRLARPAIGLLGLATDAVLFLLRVKPRPQSEVSEDEVKLLMQEGSHTGVFHPAESRMVESVLSFDQRPVTDIMTPRGKLVFIRHDEKPETLWHKIVVSGHSHYPVHSGNRDRVVGVISVKAIYANAAAGVVPAVKDLMVAPLFVPANENVAALLENFKRSGRHMAVVRDADRKSTRLNSSHRT
mgnify:CR=1 FL=1